MRPVLKPALRRLWRADNAIQLGADPLYGVVLDGYDATAADVLALLDGVRRVEDVIAAATEKGLPESEVRALLDLLARVNALDDASAAPRGFARRERARLGPDLATLTLLTTQPGDAARTMEIRRAATVLVVGAGRVGSLVAALLGAAGIGQVTIRDDQVSTPRDAVPGGLCPTDEGQPRAIAAMAAAQRAGAASVEGGVRPPDAADCHMADVAVIASDWWLTPPGALVELLRTVGVPYLLTGVRETYGVVGPLVLPGRTSCPHCHDLHRAERDPSWPMVAAQLATDGRGFDAACDVTLAAGVAALTAGQVLAHLIGPGLTRCVDATLELRLPEWTVRRRVWTPHEDCRCGAAEVVAEALAADADEEVARALEEAAGDLAATVTDELAVRDTRAPGAGGATAPENAVDAGGAYDDVRDGVVGARCTDGAEVPGPTTTGGGDEKAEGAA